MPGTPFDAPLERDGLGQPMTMTPAAPAFGGAPLVIPHAPQPSGVPNFMPMPPQTLQQPRQPNFLGAIAPIVGSFAAGGKDPAAVGAGLAAWMRGQDLRRQEIETADERISRKQLERAKFYQAVVQAAQSTDDEIALQNDLAALKPLADFYGVSLSGITISDTKKAAKERKLMADAVDTAVRQHGQEILNRDDVTLQLSDGRRVSMASARQALGGGVTDPSGKSVPVVGKPDALTPNTPEEQFYATYAKERGKKTFAELPAKEQTSARAEWAKSGRAADTATPGSFEDYLAAPPARQAEIRDARKGFLQSDDKTGTGPRDRYSVQQVTKPDGTIGLVRVNVDTGAVDAVGLPDGAGAGKASDTERLSRAYYDRTIASDKTALDFEKSLTGLGSQFDVKLPNLLRSEQGQRYRQAKDEFINAALRRESGAAIQPSEYERFDKIYFVMPGDTPATIAQKQQARARVVAGFKVAAGNLGATPKGKSDPAWIR